MNFNDDSPIGWIPIEQIASGINIHEKRYKLCLWFCPHQNKSDILFAETLWCLNDTELWLTWSPVEIKQIKM